MVDSVVFPRKDHILLVEDDRGRREIVLHESTYSLGRAQHCDIRLRSQFVSRHHATLIQGQREDGSLYYEIVDGDRDGKVSANGLVINGRKLTTHVLKHGDEVVFGPQVSATYHYRQRDTFPTMPFNDPFDITLIDPAMVEDEDDLEATQKNNSEKMN